MEAVVSAIDGRPADLPLVSAVIPAYNSEKFVHRAIESALAQSHHLLEVIVVDDGSVDSTASVAGRYPVTVITKENGGPASARNVGIRAARGEWIALLDHDDWWSVDKTRKQLEYAGPGISAVFCEKIPGSESVDFEAMFWRNYGGAPSSTIIKRQALLDIGLFDDDRAVLGVEDYNLWLRFLWSGYRFVVTPKLYEFRPAEDHYSGKPDKMLVAELANIEKIGRLAKFTPETIAARKRAARLEYIPDLIELRHLTLARQQIALLGLHADSMRYWGAFLPARVLDWRRLLLRRLRSMF